MSGHYPGFASPNHQGNYPNQMVNQQMVNRNMGGVMGPMMNMPSMPNQQMVNPMMGPQGMNYNQGGMPNPGMGGHMNMQGAGVHVSPMHIQQPQNTPPQNTYQQHHIQQQMQMVHQQPHHPNQAMMADDRQNPEQQHSSQFHMQQQQHLQSMPQMNQNMQNPMQMQPKMGLPTSNQQAPIQGIQPNMNLQNSAINPNNPMIQMSQSNQQQMQMNQQQLQQQQMQQQLQQQLQQQQAQQAQQQQQQAVQQQQQTPTPQPQAQQQQVQTQQHASNVAQPQQPQQTPQTQQTQQTQQQQQQNQHFNVVYLCRYGQETIQDIVGRFQEVFSTLKSVHPPIGANIGNSDKKVTEIFRTIRLLFRRLRLIVEKCSDKSLLDTEHINAESLLPFKDEPDSKVDHTHTEEYKKLLQENRELTETVTIRNKQLREIIDRIRIIIWEINTMLNMRKS